MMKVLVIGASGFVGSYLMEHFRGYGTSTAGDDRLFRFDLMQPEELSRIADEINPDLIINSAGITNVDACERDPDAASVINGESVKYLSRIAREYGSGFVQISTDYVFDGKKGNYSEGDPVNPINSYGKSKLAGEKHALSGNSIVLRISTPFGHGIPGGKMTFLDFVAQNLKAGKGIKAVTDQFTTPTFVGDIAPAIENLFNAGKHGIYHLGVPEKISRFDFSIKVAKICGLDRSLVSTAKLSDFKFEAERPMDTSLNTEKISEIFLPGNLDESLKQIFQD